MPRWRGCRVGRTRVPRPPRVPWSPEPTRCNVRSKRNPMTGFAWSYPRRTAGRRPVLRRAPLARAIDLARVGGRPPPLCEGEVVTLGGRPRTRPVGRPVRVDLVDARSVASLGSGGKRLRSGRDPRPRPRHRRPRPGVRLRVREAGLQLAFFQGPHVLLAGHHGAGRNEGAVGDLHDLIGGAFGTHYYGPLADLNVVS